MPIARVQMPDGRIARIEVPEGTTPEQATAMAQRVVPGASKGAWYDRPAPKPRTLGNYASMGARSVARGLGDVAGFADSLAVVPNLINQAMGRPSLGEVVKQGVETGANRAGWAAPRTGGERLASEFVRGATAAVPILMGGGPLAAQPVRQLIGGGSAMASGELARQQGAGEVGQTAAMLGGGVLGYGLSGIPSALMNMRVGPKAAAAAAPRIAPQQNPVAPLGRAAVVRNEIMRRAGVQNPTTGMVTRDPRIWKFEQDTAKMPGVGDELLGALKGVEDDIANSARNIVDRQGGAIGGEATGARLSKVLADKNDDLAQEVSALYKTVREQSGNARIPALENLKATYSHPEWADNAQFDDMAAAINKRLGRYADADGGASGLTVGQSEELRKFIGNLGPNDRQGWAMRRVFQDALDADVLDNFGGTPFANARAAAAARFAEFGKTLPGKVAAGDIPAERLSERLLSKSTSLQDVRQLRQSLTTGRKAEQGKEALDTLGAQVLDDLFAKGITPDNKVNGTTLYNRFNELAPRLQIILGPQRYKEVRRLALSARYATADVPRSAVNYSNSATTLASMLGPDASRSAAGNLLPNLARRVAGIAVGSTGGVTGALAGDAAAAAANNAIASRAARKTAESIAGKVMLSRSPQMAAAEIARINSVANDVAADPVVRRFAQSLAGSMGLPAGGVMPALNRTGEMLMLEAPRRLSAGETPEDQPR